jgi:cytochrome c oxidase subunit 2
MNFGEKLRIKSNTLKAVSLGLVMAFAPQIAVAQEAAETAVDAAPADPVAGASAYTPLGPDMIKGQPVDGAIWFQDQHSSIGHTALWMHDVVLMPIITVICLFVLGLLLWIVVRYNRRRNPVPAKTSHNSLLEVVWTLIPVLILVGIAVPSISLLAKQYESPPENALTVKVTGYQWYWGYSYPDNGDFEVISNMMSEEEAKEKGFPEHLEVDNRVVVPAGVPIRLQITAADVIHSFAVPSLWFKIDAVPGRLNERLLTIDEPGIYYGQCSELCGARHGYMPIAVEAVTKEQFAAWVASQGGTMGGAEAPAPVPTADDAAGVAPEEAAAPAV